MATTKKKETAAKPNAGKKGAGTTSAGKKVVVMTKGGRGFHGMTKGGVIRARVDADLKGRVEAILADLGLNPSDAIRLFYAQVALRKGLPFAVKIPNAATLEAFRELEAGGLTHYENAVEMFEDMGL